MSRTAREIASTSFSLAFACGFAAFVAAAPVGFAIAGIGFGVVGVCLMLAALHQKEEYLDKQEELRNMSEGIEKIQTQNKSNNIVIQI